MEREAFLSRIREAAAAGRAHQVALNPNATPKESYVGGGSDLAASFLKEWQAVGGHGARVANQEDARNYLRKLFSDHNVRTALCWDHPVLERFGLSDFLNSASVQHVSWGALENTPPVQRWEQVFAADIGITSVEWALAETGTLVMCARPGKGRSVSLLPPIHVALIEPAQLVPDLFDIFGLLQEQADQLPANVTLITGPSKTGDIQLQLTTGVHGPGEVHALILDC